MELKNRIVLITGATGFIGANLTHTLVRRGASVHAIMKPGTDPWRLAEILPNVNCHTANLVDQKKIGKIVKTVKPNLIFHLAIQRDVVDSPAARYDTATTNIMGLLSMLEAVSNIEFSRFIYTGSSLEYGRNRAPHLESNKLEPATFYSATKAAASLFCRQWASSNQRPLVLLRIFSAYGYWESPKRLIPTAIQAGLKGLYLRLTKSGYQRDFVFVEDVVDALLLAAAAELKPGEVINIGSGKQTSNQKVVRIIQDIIGQKIDIKPGAYLPHKTDTTHWVGNIQKAKRLLGWQPKHSLQQGLKKTIQWQNSHMEYFK